MEENAYVIDCNGTQRVLFDNGFTWWNGSKTVSGPEFRTLLKIDIRNKTFNIVDLNSEYLNGKIYILIYFLDKFCKNYDKDWRDAFIEKFKDSSKLELRKGKDEQLQILECHDYRYSNLIMQYATKFDCGFIFDNNRLTFTIAYYDELSSNHIISYGTTYESAKKFIKETWKND